MRLIEEFRKAWLTFSNVNKNEGWQAIPVTGFKNVSLLAGLGMPGPREAVFLSFNGASLIRAELLPSGKGFSLESIDMDGRQWIVLTRTREGISDLFISMLENIFKLLEETDGKSGNTLLYMFLDRVAAWQDFMSSGKKYLSLESQTGLYGELIFLKSLLDKGLKNDAIKTWDGPLSGVQDFRIGYGAIEVKTTVSNDGFLAKIGSLEQLSDSTYSPLFLVGQRLEVSPSGFSLPMLIEIIRDKLIDDLVLKNEFENRLLRSGYLDEHSAFYDRLLNLIESLIFLVDSNFPKLTPDTVNPLVRSAKYEIEISSLSTNITDLNEILHKVGVIK